MAMSIKVLDNLIYIKGQGSISDNHMLNTNKMRLSHPDEKPGMMVLCDLTEVQESNVSTFGLKMLADLKLESADRYTDSHVAIIATDAKIFKLAKKYQILSSELPRKLEVFRSKSDAFRWLELKAA